MREMDRHISVERMFWNYSVILLVRSTAPYCMLTKLSWAPATIATAPHGPSRDSPHPSLLSHSCLHSYRNPNLISRPNLTPSSSDRPLLPPSKAGPDTRYTLIKSNNPLSFASTTIVSSRLFSVLTLFASSDALTGFEGRPRDIAHSISHSPGPLRTQRSYIKIK